MVLFSQGFSGFNLNAGILAVDLDLKAIFLKFFLEKDGVWLKFFILHWHSGLVRFSF